MKKNRQGCVEVEVAVPVPVSEEMQHKLQEFKERVAAWLEGVPEMMRKLVLFIFYYYGTALSEKARAAETNLRKFLEFGMAGPVVQARVRWIVGRAVCEIMTEDLVKKQGRNLEFLLERLVEWGVVRENDRDLGPTHKVKFWLGQTGTFYYPVEPCPAVCAKDVAFVFRSLYRLAVAEERQMQKARKAFLATGRKGKKAMADFFSGQDGLFILNVLDMTARCKEGEEHLQRMFPGGMIKVLSKDGECELVEDGWFGPKAFCEFVQCIYRTGVRLPVMSASDGRLKFDKRLRDDVLRAALRLHGLIRRARPGEDSSNRAKT